MRAEGDLLALLGRHEHEREKETDRERERETEAAVSLRPARYTLAAAALHARVRGVRHGAKRG